ncbi:hypothetical protein [Salipaludibacillus sp. CF4.18]|uniref:hypothetical protein n=1 Tax=Salipaludibacillus sp. CF4.18 TaxID=3373081 RepID=UPI003EE426C2
MKKYLFVITFFSIFLFGCQQGALTNGNDSTKDRVYSSLWDENSINVKQKKTTGTTLQ